MYRKDCNLAAQLLQCNKSLYRTQLSEVRPVLLRCAVPHFIVFIVKISATYLCSDQLNQSYKELMDTKQINQYYYVEKCEIKGHIYKRKKNQQLYNTFTEEKQMLLCSELVVSCHLQ